MRCLMGKFPLSPPSVCTNRPSDTRPHIPRQSDIYNMVEFFRQAVEFGARAGRMPPEAESRAVQSGYCGRT